MATDRADILVVLPTLGWRLDTLERAISSATSQQGVAVRVVVVVPDDRAEAIGLSQRLGVEVLSDPGRGMSAAINAGLAARRGETFYIWLGDDDYYQPGGLAALHRLHETHPDALVAYGACNYVDDAGETIWVSRAGGLARTLLGVGPNLIPHPAAMMRLDALEAVGGYDDNLRLVMDLDVLLKLKKKGLFVHTTEVVSAFGWHDDSLTVADRRASGREARMVKRRHLPPWIRLIEPLWEYPVDLASRLAARRLNRRRNIDENH